MDGKLKNLSLNRSQYLYIVELMIISLNFESDRIIDEVNDKNYYLSVDLLFPNLPVFTIKEKNVESLKRRKNKLSSDDFFTPGISCLFSKCPNDFSRMADGKELLKVKIYKKNINAICEEIEDIDKQPICQAEMQFHQCLCDQFNKVLIKDNYLPEPFEIRKAYDLFDTIKEPCGTLELFTRISCCGKSMITQFCQNQNQLIFNNINSTNKFSCSHVLSAKEKRLDTSVNVPKAKTIVGISQLCADLQIKIHQFPSTSITQILRMQNSSSLNQNILPSITK